MLISSGLNAQEIPCIEYVHKGFSTGPHPTSPIFPGCESFKESNDSLNRCFGKQISKRIAGKFGWEVSPISKDVDSADLFKTKITVDIDIAGKLNMYLKNMVHTEFENQLVEKLNEISDETTGIIPAKYEGNYCSPYKYTLPVLFDLTEWNEN